MADTPMLDLTTGVLVGGYGGCPMWSAGRWRRLAVGVLRLPGGAVRFGFYARGSMVGGVGPEVVAVGAVPRRVVAVRARTVAG